MEEIEKYKSQFIGKKIINIYHTNQEKGTVLLEGLGYAYYFSTVFEIEGNKKYRFGNNFISKWDESEKLYKVTHENWVIKENIAFNNIKISDIIKDEYDDIYIKLENRVTIYHTIDYGDQLFFGDFSDIFDSENKLK